MSTQTSNSKNTWECTSSTSNKYGFEPFTTEMDRKCIICEFEHITHVHHIIPLSKGGDHCEENVVILCPNHHKMVHSARLADKINLPKKGKKRSYTTKELKYKKERDRALVESARIIIKFSHKRDKLDEKTKVVLAKKLTKLFRKYNIDHIDCLSYTLGIKRESFIKQYTEPRYKI